uniref:Uncharacterized protein n=1 Tax=Oryza punctata TaxID=4537 RepID=A0A0E0LYW7_ORYPU
MLCLGRPTPNQNIGLFRITSFHLASSLAPSPALPPLPHAPLLAPPHFLHRPRPCRLLSPADLARAASSTDRLLHRIHAVNHPPLFFGFLDVDGGFVPVEVHHPAPSSSAICRDILDGRVLFSHDADGPHEDRKPVYPNVPFS